MGEVYRARDGRLGREVAVKLLPEEFFEDPERVARFEREARLLATLNHSGIATAFREPERRWQIAGSGAGHPFWRSDGKELYYLDRELRLTAVEVRQHATAIEWGPPETLFAHGTFERLNGGGNRFLKLVPQEHDADAPLTLLFNGPSLVKQRGAP